jgi:Xaa-Pro aminopeptidase
MKTTTRLNALRSVFSKVKCDAFMVSHSPNVRYLSGFTGSNGMLLLTRSETIFFTDFRYKNQAAEQIGDAARIVICKNGLWPEAAKIIRHELIKRVGIEADHTTVSEANSIEKLIGNYASIIPTQNVVEKRRLLKDEDELVIIHEAVRVADETFAEALALVRPGVSEQEISVAIENGIRRRGGSGTSFQSIVASGVRSSLPHGIASEKIIEAGDLLTIDMGAIWGGYCSDMTRTVCVGKANEKQREIYELVYKAQTTVQEALRPDLSCFDADKIARDIITAGGYGPNFGHGLGHGVGIDIHEAPRLSYLGKGKLEAGMIVTNEPGIYVDDFGGVRIEDMLLITPDGSQVLTGTEKPATLLEI